MTRWMNHVTIAAPRNGTSSHTVDPASASNVVAGQEFATTAGRLLLCFADGSVTSTTPSGWTLPTGGSAIDWTGLYVWTRLAAGGDTITTTHSSSDFPVIFDIYEFLEGSNFLGAASATGVSDGAAGVTLSGLTGTRWDAGIMGQSEDTAFPETVSWDLGTEAVENSVVKGGSGPTEGYTYSLTYTEEGIGSSAAFAATTNKVPFVSQERLVVAVDVSGEDASYALGSQVIVA